MVYLVVTSGLNNYQRCHVLGYNASNSASPTPYLTSEAPNYTDQLPESKLSSNRIDIC